MSTGSIADEVDVEAALRVLRKQWEALPTLGVDPASYARGGDLPAQNRNRALRALSSIVNDAVYIYDAFRRDSETIHEWARDQYARTIDPKLLAFWRSVRPLLPGLFAREIRERGFFLSREIANVEGSFGIERLCSLRKISDQNESWAAGWLMDVWPFIDDTLELMDYGMAQRLLDGEDASVPAIRWVEEELRPLSRRLDLTFRVVLVLGDDAGLAPSSRYRKREIPFDRGFWARPFILPARDPRGIPSEKIRELLKWSVKYWGLSINPDEDYGDPEECYGDVDRWDWDSTDKFLASDETWQVLGSAFFRPKQWVDNFRALRPVITTSKLPPEIRRRTKEIFDAFVIGNYISVLLLCRGVLEFALIDRGEVLGISVYSGKARTQSNIRKLEYLVADAKEKRPSLGEAMDEIRLQGNTYAHPRRKKGEVSEQEIEILRKEALGILGYLKLFLEGIYGPGLGSRA